MRPPRFRLGKLEGGEISQLVHANTFEREATSGPARLRIGPAHPLQLFWKLFTSLPTPVFLLYVLHTSRCDNELGRYQSPPLEWDAVDAFLDRFGDYLGRDGRHDLWLHSPSANATLVWDRHDVIHAYGPLDEFQETLVDSGVAQEAAADLPVPHVHLYHPEFDDAEKAIVKYFDWKMAPLTPADVQVA